MQRAPVSHETLASAVARIAGVLASDRFPAGERAALRRMVPHRLPPVSFYRFALHHLPTGWDAASETRKDWMTIVAGIALMSPHAHRPDEGLGTALARGGYAELRLERLLAARDDVLRVLLLRACRFLAAKGLPFNWADAARLLRTRGENEREALHRHIARAYYRELRD